VHALNFSECREQRDAAAAHSDTIEPCDKEPHVRLEDRDSVHVDCLSITQRDRSSNYKNGVICLHDQLAFRSNSGAKFARTDHATINHRIVATIRARVVLRKFDHDRKDETEDHHDIALSEGVDAIRLER